MQVRLTMALAAMLLLGGLTAAPVAASGVTSPANDVGPVDWGTTVAPPVTLEHAPSALGKKYPPATQHARDWAYAHLGARQFRCIDLLWHYESGWRVAAGNPTSGAFGIPQAVPGSKMHAAGADWRTNPLTQVKWGLRYVGRYGGACGAWAFYQNHGWY